VLGRVGLRNAEGVPRRLGDGPCKVCEGRRKVVNCRERGIWRGGSGGSKTSEGME